MAYSEILAQRMRVVLTDMVQDGKIPGYGEKKMFGGIAFLVQGNMTCAVIGANLIVRLDPQQFAQNLQLPHTRTFDMTGRPMAGWIVVEPPGTMAETSLAGWIAQGAAYALSLPQK